LAWPGILDFHDLKLHTREIPRETGDCVRSLDRSIELQFTLRNVTGRTKIVADLRASRVVFSRGEVDLVMTGTTGHTAGFGHPIHALAARPVMASLAVVDLLWESDVGEIVDGLPIPNDYVRTFKY
jgi:hypothetical protein